METKDLVWPPKAPHGRDIDTAVEDKYARYQSVSKMADIQPGVRFFRSKYGMTEEVEVTIEQQQESD